MQFRQPYGVNWLTFERHALGHLPGDGLPAQSLLPSRWQRAPVLDDFDITHGLQVTASAAYVPSLSEIAGETAGSALVLRVWAGDHVAGLTAEK